MRPKWRLNGSVKYKSGKIAMLCGLAANIFTTQPKAKKILSHKNSVIILWSKCISTRIRFHIKRKRRQKSLNFYACRCRFLKSRKKFSFCRVFINECLDCAFEIILLSFYCFSFPTSASRSRIYALIISLFEHKNLHSIYDFVEKYYSRRDLEMETT